MENKNKNKVQNEEVTETDRLRDALERSNKRVQELQKTIDQAEETVYDYGCKILRLEGEIAVYKEIVDKFIYSKRGNNAGNQSK